MNTYQIYCSFFAVDEFSVCCKNFSLNILQYTFLAPTGGHCTELIPEIQWEKTYNSNNNNNTDPLRCQMYELFWFSDMNKDWFYTIQGSARIKIHYMSSQWKDHYHLLIPVLVDHKLWMEINPWNLLLILVFETVVNVPNSFPLCINRIWIIC